MIANQGWHKSTNNTTYFFTCGFDLPTVVDNLSNYIYALIR